MRGSNQPLIEVYLIRETYRLPRVVRLFSKAWQASNTAIQLPLACDQLEARLARAIAASSSWHE